MDHDDHDDNKEVHAAELELGYQTGLGFGQALASTKPRSQERANLSAQRPTLSRESTRQKELQRLERQEGIQPIVNPTGLVSREEPQLTMPVRAGNCEREVAHLRGMKSRTLSVAATPQRYRSSSRKLQRMAAAAVAAAAAAAASQDLRIPFGSGHDLNGAQIAAKPRRDIASDRPISPLSNTGARASSPHQEPRTLYPLSDDVTARFDGLRVLTTSLAVSIATPESIQLKRNLKPKKVMRRGATWLESQQLAAGDQSVVQNAFLEAEVDNSPAARHNQRHPRSPDENGTPLMGVFAGANPPRIQVSIGGEMVRMIPTSIASFLGNGESWRLDPRLPPTQRADGLQYAGRWSAEPVLEHMSNAMGRARKLKGSSPDASYGGSRKLESSRGKKSCRSAEEVCDTWTHEESGRAAHSGLVGGRLPSLLRDGFRSRLGKKLDKLAKLSRDASVSTHGSYQASTMGKMPASEVQHVHNAIGAITAERLRITWHAAAAQEPHLFPSVVKHQAQLGWPGVAARWEEDEGATRGVRGQEPSGGGWRASVQGPAGSGAQEPAPLAALSEAAREHKSRPLEEKSRRERGGV